MTVSSPPLYMTADEFLALPDDGVDRELIDGEVRERPMTVRNNQHTACTTEIAFRLRLWTGTQPEPRGQVLTGDAGFRFADKSVVGIDVAYVSADVYGPIRDEVVVISGVPVLAVEILSPSDTHEDVADKVKLYLRSGVALVWIADPRFKTITVFQPGQEPALFNSTQVLDGGAILSGFSVPVSALFA